MILIPTPKDLLFSRNDPLDPRLGDLVALASGFQSAPDFTSYLHEHFQNQKNKNFALMGYPDDEGIKINGGRLGASSAPNEIRRFLYKMTPAVYAERAFSLLDCGNLAVSELSLEKRHETASLSAETVLTNDGCWIGLGGGHDYGYAEASAFLRWAQSSAQKLRPLVINFDAHLDVRPPTNGFSSGTPFYRMLEMNLPVDFAEIGIQGHCNSRSHLEWVRAKGARVLTQEEVESSGEPLLTHVIRLLGDWVERRRPVFISVDIDAFSSAVAPGCSQSWATGFLPQEFFPCFNFLCSRLDARMLGIYEVSPALDHDGRTAKLAAQIAHRFLTLA